MHQNTKAWGTLHFFLVLPFPLYLYPTDLQNITNFRSEIDVSLHGLQHLENTIRQGLIFRATLTNNCQHAPKCVSVMTDITVCKYRGRIHCVILGDTTQDSQGEKKNNARKAIFCNDLLPSYNESTVTMKIYAVLSNFNVDASCLYAALN